MKTAAVEVELPYRFEPRPYQVPLLRAMDQGCARAVQVWHRRSGKEKTDLAGVLSRKMVERPGSYFYVFPELTQGRKILWDGMDKDGFRFLDHFPLAILDGPPNNTEMKLRLRRELGGSMLQVVGSDRYNTVVGTNPVGMVLSEYSLQDPACWNFFRPIMAENDGWAIFNFTPRGENHAYDMHELAKADPFHPVSNPTGWFSEVLTVEDTQAIPKSVLEQERREIVRLHGNDSVYLQEYMCSFTVPISGAYYAEHISRALREGRVGSVPWEPQLQTHTWWDLGLNDRMAIWFVQLVGKEIRLIDYVEGTDKGIDHYIGVLREKPYSYGRHVAPHDIEVRELTNGRSRKDTARAMGIRFEVAPKLPVVDGINAVRSVFDRCHFDKEATREGLNALKNYRKVYDERRKTYGNVPHHDWSSNGADAFRYMAVSQPGSGAKPEAAYSIPGQGTSGARRTKPEWMS